MITNNVKYALKKCNNGKILVDISLAKDEYLVAEMIGGIFKELGHMVLGKATGGRQAVARTK